MSRCRLEPMIKVRRMVQGHLWGILNVTQMEAAKSIAESVNEMIQKIKERGCGYRDRARSRMAIVFHNGGGALLPAEVSEG
ncbi:MAG: transposase [Blastocatellia bacterium]